MQDVPADKAKIPAVIRLEADALTVGSEGADTGQLEAQSLSRGKSARDLRNEADEAEHDRSQQFKKHFERMTVCTVWVLFVVFLIFGLVWAWHIVLPQFGWLTADQLDKVTGLLTGGVIAGLIADHVKKRMS